MTRPDLPRDRLIRITLVILVMLIGLAGSAGAASVTVAASNSQVTSSAQYLCDGSNDQVEIQAAINQLALTGGDVYLLDGTFTVAGTIKLASGVNLIGKGTEVTILKFVSEGWVQAYGNNVISNLQTTGATGFLIGGSHVRVTSVTVRNYTAKIAAFHIYACKTTLTDITFTACNAIDGWSYGFLNAGEGSPNAISEITYSGCSAINCGRTSQYNPWITGFDFADVTDITNLRVENCRAEGCWESGFHFEVATNKNNAILKNCVSINNGQKRYKGYLSYGAGFMGGSPTMQFIDCTSQGNIVGFRLTDGATVIRGKDTGSINAFSTTDHHSIVLTDCWSDQAEQWALYGLNSHDVTATGFVVTNPAGNPFPALFISSSQYPSYNMNIHLGSSASSTSTPALTPTTVTSQPTNVPKVPISTSSVTVPGKLLAADFEAGGEGVAYHDTTPGNEGGAYRDGDVDIEIMAGETGPTIAFSRAGEWLMYQITVPTAGAYTVTARTSNPDSSSKSILLAVDGTDASTLQVPETGSFDRYTDVTVPIYLAAGEHQLRLTFEDDRQNLAWLIFARAPVSGSEPTPVVTAIITQPPASGGGSSFSVAPTSGKRSLLVSFTDTSPGSPVGWEWEVTGGWASPATSTKQNPSIWLNEATIYSVTLTVTYADGSRKTTTMENLITVTS